MMFHWSIFIRYWLISANMKKILVIQTAFIGDVILATAVVEKLHLHFPSAHIDFLLRKGNENVLEGHPFIHELLIWDKSSFKFKNLLKLIRTIRKNKYDHVFNLQRFLSSGLLTVFSGAKVTVGFTKNPLSFIFSKAVSHIIGTNQAEMIHEVERNLGLVEKWTDKQLVKPKIYPFPSDFEKVKITEKYLTISPASIWFTKQYPVEKWVSFIDRVGEDAEIFLLGGKSDVEICRMIQRQTKHSKVRILAGQLSLKESAAVMKGAIMNYCNDSAPLHLASAVNAPVTAIFCSTLPAFGFTPLSERAFVVETKQPLPCRPCGLHGKKACPEGHFKCSDIEVEQLLAKLK
jgi:heptosyltransferase II